MAVCLIVGIIKAPTEVAIRINIAIKGLDWIPLHFMAIFRGLGTPGAGLLK